MTTLSASCSSFDLKSTTVAFGLLSQSDFRRQLESGLRLILLTEGSADGENILVVHIILRFCRVDEPVAMDGVWCVNIGNFLS